MLTSEAGGCSIGIELNIPDALTDAAESHPLNKYLAANTVTIVIPACTCICSSLTVLQRTIRQSTWSCVPFVIHRTAYNFSTVLAYTRAHIYTHTLYTFLTRYKT